MLITFCLHIDNKLDFSGVFSGHGVLTYSNGDHLEGSFYGNYTDGMKFNGTIYKTVRGSPNRIKGQLQTHHSASVDENDSSATANAIGRYSVIPEQKWSAIFNFKRTPFFVHFFVLHFFKSRLVSNQD